VESSLRDGDFPNLVFSILIFEFLLRIMLEFKNVSKWFNGTQGKVTALKDISFTVEAGELLAIRGPSGCGKTTLLLAAGGLLRPSEGQINLHGQDPYELSPEQRSKLRARMIGFVFQQFHLIPYLTVRQNILAASLALVLWGGEVLSGPLLVVTFGVITGTFSSVFIAAPILLFIEQKWPGEDVRGAKDIGAAGGTTVVTPKKA